MFWYFSAQPQFKVFREEIATVKGRSSMKSVSSRSFVAFCSDEGFHWRWGQDHGPGLSNEKFQFCRSLLFEIGAIRILLILLRCVHMNKDSLERNDHRTSLRATGSETGCPIVDHHFRAITFIAAKLIGWIPRVEKRASLRLFPFLNSDFESSVEEVRMAHHIARIGMASQEGISQKRSSV